MVGILKMSLYGARDAAVYFQKEVAKLMASIGFDRAVYYASLFYHERSGPEVLVHDDDFVAVGRRQEVEQFKSQLSKRFTVKNKVMGSRADLGEVQEARVLNRIIRVKETGWEYEADQRHADLIVQMLKLDKANPVKTAGGEEPKWKMEDNERMLGKEEATLYRVVAARANYLALDRLDVQFATKECCRGTA